MSETDSGSGDGSQSKRATFAGTAEDIVEVISEHATSADWISKGKASKRKVLKHGLLMRALHALMPFLNFQKLKMKRAVKATLAKNRGGWDHDLEEQHEKPWVHSHTERIRDLCFFAGKALRRENRWALELFGV